jgi:hypothetical protein
VAFLLAIGLGLLALAFVLYPLLPSVAHSASVARDFAETGAESTPAKSAGEQELAARDALQEVELDYQLGNIAESDYRGLRERYVRRAILALKSRYDNETTIDDEIEARLSQMKEQDQDAHSHN